MIGCLAGLALLLARQDLHHGLILPNRTGRAPIVMLAPAEQRLDPPKLSPKQGWMFEWVVRGYAQLSVNNMVESPRLRVFSQEHRDEGDPALPVARMLMRLWEMNVREYRVDHAYKYNAQLVDFYLCYGGKAGGEQLFGRDDEGGKPHDVNTVYIYDLRSFSSPVEMARELSHEYGHASLPPVGGYTAPENWANGYLGEKLYLRYLRDAIAAKRLDPDDALGANLPSLNLWVRRNVDPLVLRSATGDKPSTALAARGSVGMEAFIGLVLYVQTLLPPRAFAMALWGIGSTKAEDFLDSTVTAVSSMKSVTFRIPAVVKGKSIWLPIGKGELAGGTITERDGNWAKVKPSGKGPIRVTNPG